MKNNSVTDSILRPRKQLFKKNGSFLKVNAVGFDDQASESVSGNNDSSKTMKLN